VDVDARNALGETALMRAALAGHMSICSDLLARGADPEACTLTAACAPPLPYPPASTRSRTSHGTSHGTPSISARSAPRAAQATDARGANATHWAAKRDYGNMLVFLGLLTVS
jgi:ankyrin repeat protein